MCGVLPVFLSDWTPIEEILPMDLHDYLDCEDILKKSGEFDF